MASEVITQQPIQPPVSASFGVGDIVIFLIIVIIGVIIYVIWKAKSVQKEEEKEDDKYLKHLDETRRLCQMNANDKFYKSQWRVSKNAEIHRIFEHRGRIYLEPLIGAWTHYMGHIFDKSGCYNFAFCCQKKFWVMPIVEVLKVPIEYVHEQDDRIVINCVSIDRMTSSTPYLPVYLGVDGKVTKDGFTYMENMYKDRLSAEVIQEQGNSFLKTIAEMPEYNPEIQYNRRSSPRDGGDLN